MTYVILHCLSPCPKPIISFIFHFFSTFFLLIPRMVYGMDRIVLNLSILKFFVFRDPRGPQKQGFFT